MDLFDKNTGKPLDVPESERENAILSGTVAVKPDKDYFLIDKNNNALSVPGSKVEDLVRQGNRFETETETAVRRYKNDPNRTVLDTVYQNVAAAGRNFVDESLFGSLDLTREIQAKNNPKNLELLKQEADYNDAAVGRWIGGAAAIFNPFGGTENAVLKGTGAAVRGAETAGAYVAKKIFGEVAETAATKTGSFLAKTATTGVVAGAPQAIARQVAEDYDWSTHLDTVVIKDNAAAGELIAGGFSQQIPARLKDLSSDIAFSAGANTAGGILGNLVSSAITSSTSPNAIKKMREWADGYAFSQLSFKTPELSEMKKKFKDWISSDVTDAEIMGNMRDLVKASGQSIFRPRAVEEGVKNLMQDAGTAMNTLRTQADEAFKSGLYAPALTDSLKEAAAKYSSSAIKATSAKGAQIGEVAEEVERQLATKFKEKDVLLNFDDYQNLRNEVKLAFKDKMTDSGYNEAYQIIGSFLTDAMDQATIGNPTLGTAWRSAKEMYGKTKILVPLIDKAETRRSSNNIWDLYDGVAGASAMANYDTSMLAYMASQKTLRRWGAGGASYAIDGIANRVENYARGSSEAFSRLSNATNTYGMTPILGTTKAVARAANVRSNEALQSVFPDLDDDSNTRQAKYVQMLSAVNTLVSNPEIAQDLADRYTGHIDELPLTKGQAASTSMRGLEYLRALIPKPKEMSSPLDPKQVLPSDSEISRFSRRFQAVVAPESVFSEIAEGTVMPEHIDALRKVYPSLYNHLSEYYLERVNEAGYRIPYKARSRLKFIIDTTEPTAQQGIKVLQLQNSFAQGNQPQPTPLANSRITESSRAGTDVTRMINE